MNYKKIAQSILREYRKVKNGQRTTRYKRQFRESSNSYKKNETYGMKRQMQTLELSAVHFMPLFAVQQSLVVKVNGRFVMMYFSGSSGCPDISEIIEFNLYFTFDENLFIIDKAIKPKLLLPDALL